MYLDGVPCLHIMDRATTFSVTTTLQSRHMSTQIQAFNTSWRAVFGTPVTMQADKEYDNHEFIEFCNTAGIELTIVPTEAHDTQGEIERANGIIKSFSKRLDAWLSSCSFSAISSLMAVTLSLCFLDFSWFTSAFSVLKALSQATQ